jgi:hypothetical protein
LVLPKVGGGGDGMKTKKVLVEVWSLLPIGSKVENVE